MSTDLPVTCIFTDIGGVLGTNGWDRTMRKRAAEHFKLNYDEMDERHHLTFDTYEEGKLTLDEYLLRVVFYEPRDFSQADFKQFMFDQSQPFPDMLRMMAALKARHGLKVAVVSNEGRELTEHRVAKFGLSAFVDFFIVSSYVHFRKPDADIFRMAIDVAQVPVSQVAYLEDRLMFVEVAQTLGLRGLHHVNHDATRAAFAALGLTLD